MSLKTFQVALFFSAISAAQATEPKSVLVPYDSPQFKEAASSIVVITLDEQTDKKFGDFYESGKHLDKLNDFLVAIKDLDAKAIGIDIDLYNPESATLKKNRAALLTTLEKFRTPVVLGFVDKVGRSRIRELSNPSNQIHPGFCVSRPNPLPEKGFDLSIQWRALLSTQLFLSGNNVQIPDDIQVSLKIDPPTDESFVQHISVQDFLGLSGTEQRKVIQSRHVLLGVDYDHIDVPVSEGDHKINGVFLHAAALATLIAASSKGALSPESSAVSIKLQNN